MAKLLMIDNYDSFTYNLVQYLGELGCEVAVHRNAASEFEAGQVTGYTLAIPRGLGRWCSSTTPHAR